MDLQCINNNWSSPYVVFLSLVLSCVLIPLFFCKFMFCHFCPHIYWPTLWASLSNYLMVPKGIFPSIWFPCFGPLSMLFTPNILPHHSMCIYFVHISQYCIVIFSSNFFCLNSRDISSTTTKPIGLFLLRLVFFSLSAL
jgi:hypothetical protein